MKKATRILVPVLLSLFILASIVWYLFIYDRDFTRDTLLEQARYQDSHGNAQLSSMFYDLAYNFSNKDEHVAIELANQYKADGNFTKAEYTLTHAINAGATADLYTALCRTYVEQDKLLDAVNMLDNITDPAMKAQLDALRPSAPAADHPAGYYNQYMDVHLSSNGQYIFYTSNGEYPSIQGSVYGAGIPLPTGETTIYAVSVDKNGLVSPLTVLGYTITGVVEPVTFVDPAMDAAIRGLLNADEDDVIYTNQLWDITEFTVPEGVKTFADLPKMPYLVSLTARDHEIDALGHLSTLANLETLDLSGCRFPADDLAILASLPSLTHLVLDECGLSTIAGLAGSPKLTHLDLSNNTVRNLEVLAPMTTLQELLLSHNAVTELSDLSGLTNLQALDISYNSVSSLTPIASCPKLNRLAAGNNQLSDLDGISSLPLLSTLYVNHNALTDVSILSQCPELKDLNISNNEITDISSAGTLAKLVTFNFSHNQVEELPKWPDGCPMETINGAYNNLTSIDNLAGMNALANVNMDYNELTNIDSLADNFCLVYVNVYGNEIEDVSKLRERDIIVNYDPT